MRKRRIVMVLAVCLLVGLLPGFSIASEAEEINPAIEASDGDEQNEDSYYHIRYSAHVQGIGWQEPVYDGEMIGTSGLAKRVEALKIEVVDTSDEVAEGAIEYRAHVQGIGWQDYVSDGALSGTAGEAKRVEALQIRLTGEAAERYDIYYRTHIQTFGWTGWACNDEIAGSEGLAKRMEAVEIRLVPKGEAAPGATNMTCYSPTSKGGVTYQAHVQSYGWMASAADGAMAGTSGKGKRLEAFYIWLNNPGDINGTPISGGIEYSAHVQSYGWMDYVSGGSLCGTIGESKRIEGIRIRLTGELAEKYHVYYRVHVQTFGTLGWAKDDEIAGTSGLAKRMEYMEIKLVDKEDAQTIAALESTGISNVSEKLLGKVTAGFYSPAASWGEQTGASVSIGATGVSRVNEALRITALPSEAELTGGICYEVHTAGNGWESAVKDGAVAGTPGSGRAVQAVKISLTGDLAKYCDIYYRAHIQAYGWIGWAKNGQIAGSTGCGYRLEALQIVLRLKGTAAPGENSDYHKTIKKGTKMIALTFDDGPGVRTMELLNTLERYRAHATFFVVGSNINRYSLCLNKAVSIGCEIGNHTYNHPSLSSLSAAGVRAEISNTNSLIQRYTGAPASILRPPYGATNSTVASVVGMPQIMWSVDTNDWRTLNTAATLNYVLRNAKDGDIVLMHDIHSSTVSAAIQMIPILQNRGFQLVTVSELAKAKGYSMTKGSVYYQFR